MSVKLGTSPSMTGSWLKCVTYLCIQYHSPPAVCNILRIHCSFDLIQFELNYAPFKWPLLEWYKLTINAMQI